jgi:putative oxidoreductase
MVLLKENYEKLGLFVLRVGAGAAMLIHGYPKLTTLISGGAIKFPSVFGMGSSVSLTAAVFAEFLCSLLLILGVKTKYVVMPLIGTMFVAAFVIHGSDPWMKKEKAVLYLLMYVVIFICGGGKYEVKK